jgi:hypothetical protein
MLAHTERMVIKAEVANTIVFAHIVVLAASLCKLHTYSLLATLVTAASAYDAVIVYSSAAGQPCKDCTVDLCLIAQQFSVRQLC